MSLSPRHRYAIWMGILAAVVVLMTVAVVDQEQDESAGERITRLNESFACPVCDGETVAESNAAVSVTIRQYIAERVADDATDEAIRNELVMAYGTRVLTNPPAEGFASLIWILPVIVAIFGAVALGAAFNRQHDREREPSEDDRLLAQRVRDQVMAAQREEEF